MSTPETGLPDPRALEVLSNEDGDLSVQVHEHSNAWRLEAAWAVMRHAIGGAPGDAAWEASVSVLIGGASAVHWAQHRDEPTEDDGCYCEEVGWWCDQIPGPSSPFWFFDHEVIDAAMKAGDAAAVVSPSPTEEGPTDG